MYVTADGDRAFLQYNISMAEHVKRSSPHMVHLPLAEHLTRPVVLREPTDVLSQPWGPFMHSRLCSLRLFDILYRTVFARHSPPAACNSSSSLSIHQVLVSTLALLLARVGGALVICLCPHPSSNPSSLQLERVNDKVGGKQVS